MIHSCHCGCEGCRCKQSVWRPIACHYDGLQLCEVAQWTPLPFDVVVAFVDDLHVDGAIYWERAHQSLTRMSPD